MGLSSFIPPEQISQAIEQISQYGLFKKLFLFFIHFAPLLKISWLIPDDLTLNSNSTAQKIDEHGIQK